MTSTPAETLESVLSAIEQQKIFLMQTTLSADRRRAAQANLALLIERQDALMKINRYTYGG